MQSFTESPKGYDDRVPRDLNSPRARLAMNAVFTLVAAPVAVTWVCYFIVTFAAVTLILFRRDLAKASGDAEALTRRISQLSNTSHPTSALVFPDLTDSPITRRFGQFRSHLMNVPGANGTQLRTSRPAVEFFEPDDVLRESLILRFYQSIPNILVGMGLFFTFLGLTAALTFAANGATSTNIAEVQASLKSLLHAASFKFISSLVALFCSILFMIQERFALRKYQRLLQSLIKTLDDRFPPLSTEELLLAQARPARLRRYADAIVTASSNALEGLFDPNLGPPREQCQLFLQHVSDLVEQSKEQTDALKTFNTDLAISVSKALDDTLSPTLRVALASLESTVSSLGSNMQSANADVLQRMIDDFGVTLREQTEHSFHQIVDSGTALATTLAATSREFRETFEGITSIGHDMREQAAAGVEMIRASVVLLSDVVQKVADTSQSMAQAGAPLASAAAAVDGLLDRLSALQEGSNQSLQGLHALATSMDSSLRVTARASENVAASFERQLEAAFASYKASFGEIDHDIADAFRAMSEGISHTIEQVRVFITKSDEGVAGAVSSVEGAVSHLADELSGLEEWLTKLPPALSSLPHGIQEHSEDDDRSTSPTSNDIIDTPFRLIDTASRSIT